MMSTGKISWSNPRVLATLLLVFLCGAAAGALAVRFAARQAARSSVAVLPENKKDLLERFQKELVLSPIQVEKVEIILDDYMKYMHDLQTQMDDVRVHGKAMIVKVLNEEQRKKLERMLADARLRTLR